VREILKYKKYMKSFIDLVEEIVMFMHKIIHRYNVKMFHQV
jgi:hypothetical protein